MWPNIEECCCTVIKRINGCIIQCGIQSEAKPQREFRGEVAKMGYSRFRLSHVMPNVWFYKLRDLGRTRNQRGRRTAGKLKLESGSTLPRNSYNFGRAERVYASPPNPKLSDTDFPPEGRKQEEAVGSAANEPRRRYTGGTKTKSKSKSKSRSSTLRQSRISAGCSCRATVGSVWKFRENEDRWSSDECSDEFGENVRFRSTQPGLENCSGGKNNCHDISKFDKLESEVAWDFPALELNPSRSQNFPQVGNHRNKHIIRYVSNNIAGLPSPVPEEQHEDDYEYEDFCSEFDDSVARNVKEIFESVRDPYFVDTCITCSSSCSCRLSASSVEIDVNNMDGDGNLPTDYEGNSIKEVGILPFLAESVDPDMKMKQKYMEDLEESKPSLIRRRNAVNSQAEVKASKLMAPESRNRRHSSETTCLNDQKPPISGKRVDSGATEIQPPWKGNAVSQRSEIPTKKTVTEGKSRSAKAKQQVGSVSGSPKSDIGNAMSKRRRDFPQRSTDQKITKSKGNSPRPSTRISKPNGSGPSKTKITGEQSDDQLKDIQQKFGVDDAQSRKSSSSSSIATTVPESFAVVKCSYDPQKDFRDSMVEMIVENDIRYSKDLQQLLHSYLLLNSDEYHDVIVKVFEQVWSDLNDISL